MNIPSKEELRTLSELGQGLAVSIYMPTHEAGAATRENPIRFKNRLQEAEQLLAERGYEGGELDGLLGPARALVDDHDFWQHQRKGLALFATVGETRRYRLPVAPEEVTDVSDSFYLKPLLPLLTGDGRFFILAMSLNSVRLLEATHYGVSERALEGVPRSLEEALRYDDDPEPTLRSYATAGPAGGGGEGGATPLQAQGAGEGDRKENIRRFFTTFDNGLKKMLAPEGDRIPLVFAGDEGLFPIYQEANQYNGLMEDFVRGNPEGVDDEMLHARAWEVVEPHFRERRERDRDAFLQKAGGDPAHASADLRDVLPAAFDSRVATLFVPLGTQRWGTFDYQARTTEFHDEETADNHDLYDLAAVHTLLNGGTVYAVDPEEVPGSGEVAAVYRF